MYISVHMNALVNNYFIHMINKFCNLQIMHKFISMYYMYMYMYMLPPP